MSNQVIERKPNGQFAKGQTGNIAGNAQRTRHLFSKAFVEALLEDFREWGAEAIVRVRTETPAAYLRVCATLIPKELKLTDSQYVKGLSDEQIEQTIEAIQNLLAARDAGASAKVVEGVAEPAALPAYRKPRRKAKRIADPEPGPRKDAPQDRVETAGGPAASKQVRASTYNNEIPAKGATE